MPADPPKTPPAGRLIGYARVSTEPQDTDPQRDGRRAAGCQDIREEHASGADRTWPVLTQLLHTIRPGETLVVVRLDRLARSVRHLLAVIEQLDGAGAHFRSVRDPVDTSTPQGMVSLQVLGAVAQFERGLIAEHTKACGAPPASVSAAISARVPAIRKVRARRDAAHLDAILSPPDSRHRLSGACARISPGETWCAS